MISFNETEIASGHFCHPYVTIVDIFWHCRRGETDT